MIICADWSIRLQKNGRKKNKYVSMGAWKYESMGVWECGSALPTVA